MVCLALYQSMGITPSASINAIGHKECRDAQFPTRFSIRQHALIAPRNSPWQLLILIHSYQLKINKAQANNTNAFWDHINLSRTPTRTSTPKLTPMPTSTLTSPLSWKFSKDAAIIWTLMPMRHVSVSPISTRFVF